MNKKILPISLSLSIILSSLSPVWAALQAEAGLTGRSESLGFVNVIPNLSLAPVVNAEENFNEGGAVPGLAIHRQGGELNSTRELTREIGARKTEVNPLVPTPMMNGGIPSERNSVAPIGAMSGREILPLLKEEKKVERLSLPKINFDGTNSSAQKISVDRHSVWAGFNLPEKNLINSPLTAGSIVSLKRFHLGAGGVAEDGSHPIVLNADPNDMASIEKALRSLVNSNPSQYGLSNQFGSPDEDMAMVHVQKLVGQSDQADSVIAIFRQWKKGTDIDGSPYYLLVDDANLRFHIKILNGKPTLMAVDGGFAPDVNPAIMTPAYTDAQLEEIAQKSLNSQPPPAKTQVQNNIRRKSPGGSFNLVALNQGPTLLAREIASLNNTWRAINIYQGNDSSGQQEMVLVDVKTGEAFPLGNQSLRLTIVSPANNIPEGEIAGSAVAMGNTLTPQGEDHGPEDAMPLPNAKVFDSQGNVVAITDENGAFTIPADVNGGKPLSITVRLDGIYGPVINDDSSDAPIVVTLTATPGQEVKVTLNPAGGNEQQDANVNAYVYSYRLFNWFKSYLGVSDPRFYTPLAGAIHANGTSLPGNADYDPATDGFYLMKRATIPEEVRGQDGTTKTVLITFENTSQPSISLHELGHRFVQRASQIALSDTQRASPAYRFVLNPISPVMGSGSNEATADTVSMFMRNSPVIGNGFILNPLPGMPAMIRTGENKTAYDPNNPDPHNQGETQMGTAWMSRKDIQTAMGDVAGAFRSAFLFVLTSLYIQPGDPMSALSHALLADMAKDGSIPHESIIRAHAKDDHGLDLPPNPPTASLVATGASGSSPTDKTAK